MNIRRSLVLSAIIVAAAVLASAASALAQTEIPPPGGKGRVVVVASGKSGPEHYTTVARAIAAMGYDVLLVDGNALEGTHGAALKDAIAQAQASPHALPGKVALVGFSLGGGIALGYGSRWPDEVAADIVWYPLTSVIHDIPTFAGGLAVPVLMFAGEADDYHDCCLIGTARSLADAAKAAGKSFDLITYPGVDHDFVDGGSHYNAKAYRDALEHTAARLKEAFSE